MSILTDNFEYKLLAILAEGNDFYAMKRIVGYVFDNKDSNIVNQKIALNYLEKLIENGDSDAMLTKGALHYSGENEFVEQDFEKAIHLYNEAVNHKNIEKKGLNITALTNLGYCYLYGRANDPDDKKAFYYFAQAAILNDGNAMYKIGDMYNNGKYVNKNSEAAFYWYKKAFLNTCNDDYNKASVAFRLGEAYLYGKGAKVSLLKALKYLQISEKHFYILAIEKPMLSNSVFASKQIKKVQEQLIEVRKKLNEII